MKRAWFQAVAYSVLFALTSSQAVVHSAPPDGKPLGSLEAVRAEVDALKKEDVAWRKIEWKTCLLDGLKASREQNKPIMLWIFIDRPIDDERC